MKRPYPAMTWVDPGPPQRRGPLAARTRGNVGRPVVLLHGLPASQRVWGLAFDAIGDHCRLVVPDLLGFGQSPRPPSGYTLADHAAAVIGCLDACGCGDEAAVVVGHSFGALVALAMARHHPGRVAAVLCLAPPLFRDATAARVALRTSLGRFGRLVGMSAAAPLLCRNLCGRRPDLARRIGSRWRPELPGALIADGVLHSWASYSQSREEILAPRRWSEWIGELRVPVRIMARTGDALTDAPLLRSLATADGRVRVDIVEGGDHGMPLYEPDVCLGAITEMVALVDGRS